MAEIFAALAPLTAVILIGLHSSTPIILAGVGGSFAAQVNVFNIALEGMMLAGAFVGFAVSDLTSSATLGIFSGAGAGAIVAVIFGIATVTFNANEIVVGFTINVIVVSLTAVLLTAIYGVTGSRLSMTAGLVRPIFGPVDVVTILAFASIFIGHWYTFFTKSGLRMRAIGGSVLAASAAGINVQQYRYRALLFGGVLCGMGGAYLPLSGLSLFSVGMTAGIGFIAVAAVVFGDGKPITVAAACLVFGFTAAASIPLQNFGYPTEIVLLLPYAIAILAIFLKSVVARKRAVQRADLDSVVAAR